MPKEKDDVATAEDLKKWLHKVICALTSSNEDIDISYVHDEQGLLFNVKVNSNDLGKVIGKEAKIANSVRTILRSAGRLHGLRASMKVDAGTGFQLKDDMR